MHMNTVVRSNENSKNNSKLSFNECKVKSLAMDFKAPSSAPLIRKIHLSY